MEQQSCNMQETILFDVRVKERRSVDVAATIQRVRKSIGTWLDARSVFYSRIAEFPVTRRMVIRINAISVCLIVGGMAVEQHPMTSLISAVCAAYIVYRMNKKSEEV